MTRAHTRTRIGCAAVVLAIVVAGCGDRREAPAEVHAARGGDARIVSLTPSATEVVAALGATALLIGVDEFSTYPEAVKALPKVGSFLSPNLELIASLHPTLVIVDDIHGKPAKALAELGIRTVECPMHSLPDVKAALVRVGAAIGKQAEAAAVVAGIDRALDEAAARKPATRPRVLIVIDRVPGKLTGLIAAGPGSWLDELLAVAGGQNVLAGASVRYPKISREEVMRAAPEVIIDASFVASAADPVHDWAALGDVPAVKAGRVKAAKAAFMLAPSPRVSEALAAVAALLE